MQRLNPEKEAKWKQRLADWRQSGLSAIKWCKAHDINYHTFKYWQTKLRESQQQQGGFIEISPIIAATENTGVTINIGPFQVRLEHNFNATVLERLLSMLGRSV